MKHPQGNNPFVRHVTLEGGGNDAAWEIALKKRGDGWIAAVAGEEIKLGPIGGAGPRRIVTIDGREVVFGWRNTRDGAEVVIDGTVYRPVVGDPRSRRYAATARPPVHSGPVEVKAPIPGMVVKVTATVGARVEKDGSLLTLSAMKLENDIRALTAGIVRAVHVAAGDAVEKGAPLVTLSAE